MIVFYSWQSDTPDSIGKAFIRDALRSAIDDINLEEADRSEVKLDHDTKGVLGSPVITATIFEKIERSGVVVVDVTLVGATNGSKRLCNSNVAIELGYALGVHGDRVLLKVMNTYYGEASSLPFDLQNRRWPVSYRLAPDANKEERNRVRRELERELRSILVQYAQSPTATNTRFEPKQHTYNKAVYWQNDENLYPRDDTELRYRGDAALMYLRIWPLEVIPSPPHEVMKNPSLLPLCFSHSSSSIRNRYGWMFYETDGAKQLVSSTQVFNSGEIWGVSRAALSERDGVGKIIPSIAYENCLRKSLDNYLDIARSNLQYPRRIGIASGLINVRGYTLAVGQIPSSGGNLSYYDDVVFEDEIDQENPATVDRALVSLFEKVFYAAGCSRPENFNGFPAQSGDGRF